MAKLKGKDVMIHMNMATQVNLDAAGEYIESHTDQNMRYKGKINRSAVIRYLSELFCKKHKLADYSDSEF